MKRESGVLPTIKRVFVAGATMSLVLGTTVATAAQPVLATWTPAVTIATPAGAQELNDPGVAVSSDGQQQSVVWIRKAPSDNRIQYATSADRGATWAAPMDVDSSSEVLSHPSVVTSQDGQHTTVAYVGNVGSMHENPHPAASRFRVGRGDQAVGGRRGRRRVSPPDYELQRIARCW